jgi:aspartate kinase
VEFAKKYGVVLEVVSSFHEKPGTLVREEVKDMEDIVVRGVAADKNQAKVTVGGAADKPGVAAGLFKELAKANINVDMIVQNVSEQGRPTSRSPCRAPSWARPARCCRGCTTRRRA